MLDLPLLTSCLNGSCRLGYMANEVIIPVIPPFETIMAERATPYSHGGLVFLFLLGEGVDPDSIRTQI